MGGLGEGCMHAARSSSLRGGVGECMLGLADAHARVCMPMHAHRGANSAPPPTTPHAAVSTLVTVVELLKKDGLATELSEWARCMSGRAGWRGCTPACVPAPSLLGTHACTPSTSNHVKACVRGSCPLVGFRTRTAAMSGAAMPSKNGAQPHTAALRRTRLIVARNEEACLHTLPTLEPPVPRSPAEVSTSLEALEDDGQARTVHVSGFLGAGPPR